MKKLKDLRKHEIDFSKKSSIYGATQGCYRHCKEDTCELGFEDVEHTLYDDNGEFRRTWTDDSEDECVATIV